MTAIKESNITESSVKEYSRVGVGVKIYFLLLTIINWTYCCHIIVPRSVVYNK